MTDARRNRGRIPVQSFLQTVERLESRVFLSASHAHHDDAGGAGSSAFSFSPSEAFKEQAKEAGTLSGKVWLDANANGKQSKFEGGLFNQTIFLDANDNGILDGGESVAETDPSGYYYFADLEPGTYNLCYDAWSGLQHTTDESASVTIADGKASRQNNFGAAVTDPDEVDILVVYTRDARGGAGSKKALVNQVRRMVSTMNSAFANSEISAKMVLAKAHEVDYNDSGTGFADRNRLKRKGESFMKEVHKMRDQLGADLATLITEEMFDVGGISFFPEPTKLDPSSVGFNVVLRSVGVSDLVFAHEYGHNFGAGHDLLTDNGGFYDDSHGHHIEVDGERYRTIMAYPLSLDEEVLPIFSNPDLTWRGEPLGDASTANNTRTVAEFAPQLADYRQRDIAGNSRAQARNLGTLVNGATQTFDEAVGVVDPSDFYKITVAGPTDVTIVLKDLKGNADVQLLKSNLKTVDSSRKSGKKNEKITRTLKAGDYYVRVFSPSQIGATYTIDVTAAATSAGSTVVAGDESGAVTPELTIEDDLFPVDDHENVSRGGELPGASDDDLASL